jgi:hypothetical protein
VNPRRPDLRDRLLSEGMSLASIDELKDRAERRAGGGSARRERRAGSERIVAVAEYRDGTIIDVIEGLDERAADARRPRIDAFARFARSPTPEAAGPKGRAASEADTRRPGSSMRRDRR